MKKQKPRLRMIRLELDARCKRPSRCRKTKCQHFGIHEFDAEQCGKRDCVFHVTETLRFGGLRDKKGKEIWGDPFKVKTIKNEFVHCEVQPYEWQ